MRKRILVLALGTAMAVSTLAACGSTSSSSTHTAETTTAAASTDATTVADEATDAPTEEATAEEVKTMTYDEFMAAAVEDAVSVKVAVAAKQAYSAEYGNTSLYAFDENGNGYFIYRIAMTQEEYDSIATGAEMTIDGFKAEWSGEVEIADVAKFALTGNTLEVPAAVDLSDKFGTDELINSQNKFFSVADYEVVATKDADGNENAFLYNWDGSGTQGDDVYFTLSNGTDSFSFLVESSLCDASSDTYKAAEGLKIGDKVDVEGFLYWYEGANPHTTKITVK